MAGPDLRNFGDCRHSLCGILGAEASSPATVDEALAINDEARRAARRLVPQCEAAAPEEGEMTMDFKHHRRCDRLAPDDP